MESLAHLHKFILYFKPFPQKKNPIHFSILPYSIFIHLPYYNGIHTRSITTRRLFTFLSSNKKERKKNRPSFFQNGYILRRGLFSHISDRLFNSMSILDYECITHIFRVYIFCPPPPYKPHLTIVYLQHFEWRKMTRNNLWQGQVFCVSLHKACCSHGVLSFVQIIHWCVSGCINWLLTLFVYIVVNGNRLMRFSGSNEKVFFLLSFPFSLTNTN